MDWWLLNFLHPTWPYPAYLALGSHAPASMFKADKATRWEFSPFAGANGIGEDKSCHSFETFLQNHGFQYSNGLILADLGCPNFRKPSFPGEFWSNSTWFWAAHGYPSRSRVDQSRPATLDTAGLYSTSTHHTKGGFSQLETSIFDWGLSS